MSAWRSAIFAAAALLSGAVAGAAARLAGGEELGGFFGAAGLLVVLLPAFIGVSSAPQAFLRGSLLAIGAAGAMLRPEPAFAFTWLQALLVLESLVLAETGLWFALCRARLSRASSAGLAATLVFTWLSAPLWLFHMLLAWPVLVQRLASVHPLFAINALLPQANWTETGLAYQLMDLNQDVPFSLPKTILPALLAHVVIALLGCGYRALSRRGMA